MNPSTQQLPWARRIELHLSVDDPEVVGFLGEYEDDQRNDHAVVALRIGSLALQRARGAVDVEAVRKEGERLVSDLKTALTTHGRELTRDVGTSLGAYLDPKTGVFQQRLDQVLRGDGELAALLEKHVGEDNSAVARALAKHLGESSPVFRLLDPRQKDGLISSLEGVVANGLADQRRQILREFSLDDESSALARLIREITDQQGRLRKGLGEDVDRLSEQLSLDHEDSALSRLVRKVDAAQLGIVEQFSLDSEGSALSRMKRELAASIASLSKQQNDFQAEVLDLLARLDERKKNAASGTEHGLVFEADLALRLQHLAEFAGDLFEHTGNTTGIVRACKKGDVVVTIGPERHGAGRAIVFEAKEDGSYNDQRALQELEQARKNRGAEVGVFVFSRLTSPTGRSFRRVGNDLLVVWDREDLASDVLLEAAYAVATALLANAEARRLELEVDLEAIERSISEIEKQATRMAGIRGKCDSIRRAADTIDEEARKIGDNLGRESQRLRDQVESLHSLHSDGVAGSTGRG